MRRRLRIGFWGPWLALVAAGGCGAAEPGSEGNAVVAGSARHLAVHAVSRERWSIVAVRANEPRAFMREGGVLALSLLDAAEIEVSGSSVMIFARGQELAAGGVLTPIDAGSHLLRDLQGAKWFEGELTAEVAGQRQLSSTWATFTLERTAAGDPRVKLCASGDSQSLVGPASAFTRRAACEPGEQELLATGHAASDSLAGSGP